MIGDPPSVRFAGARPLADAPVDALVDRADELARRWASALIATRPLAEMAAVPLESLAREAPALCAQLVRALGSDAELQQLLGSGAPAERARSSESRTGAVAAWPTPTRDASSTVRDVEALRRVVWEAALEELREPTARQVADLSDRLAYVHAALLAAALDSHTPASAIDSPSAPAPARREQVLYSSPQTTPGARRAVLIDERDELAVPPGRPRDVPAAAASATPADEPARTARETAPERLQQGGSAPARPRPRPWDTPLDAVSHGVSHGVSGRQGPSRSSAVPDGADAEMRVTRRRGAPVDERA